MYTKRRLPNSPLHNGPVIKNHHHPHQNAKQRQRQSESKNNRSHPLPNNHPCSPGHISLCFHYGLPVADYPSLSRLTIGSRSIYIIAFTPLPSES
ncbi:hypothetical protein BDW69DRAFT_163304 [Aspergillus filifer]